MIRLPSYNEVNAMDKNNSWEGKSAYLFTKDTEEGIRVRILRFLDGYVEVEDAAKRARLYPQENISYFSFLGSPGNGDPFPLSPTAGQLKTGC